MTIEVSTAEAPVEAQVTEAASEAVVETAREEVAADEVPVEVAPPAAPAQDDKLTSRFAAIARKEKATREREAQIVERERKTQELEARIQAQEAAAKSRSPLELLQAHGLSYDDVIRQMAGGGLPPEPEVDPLDAKLAPLQEKLKKFEEIEAKLKAKEEAEEQAKVQSVEQQITSGIAEAAQKHELVKSFEKLGSHQLVRNVMEEYYAEHKKILAYDEACSMVEAHLEAEYLPALTQSEKLKTRFTATAKPVAPEAKSQKAAPKATLTNALASAPKPVEVDASKMSREEWIKWAAKQG